ncbi:hypothetical protein [Bdellovibrio bacteriovorus]|uniref:hypothetical protein n=1 Tax=Bdellovibrio bacteriovorus TaxID=959 RepID=UPI0035A711A7
MKYSMIAISVFFASMTVAHAGEYSGLVQRQVRQISEQKALIQQLNHEQKGEKGNLCGYFLENLIEQKSSAIKLAATLGEDPSELLQIEIDANLCR